MRNQQQGQQAAEDEPSTATAGSGRSERDLDDYDYEVPAFDQVDTVMQEVSQAVSELSDFKSAINDLADERMEEEIVIEGPNAVPEMFRWVMPKHALESIFNEGVAWTDDEWQKVQKGLYDYFNEVMDSDRQALQDVIELALHPVAGVNADPGSEITTSPENDIPRGPCQPPRPR